MERANMEQAMRNHYGLGVADAMRPEALQNLTPTARHKTYARHRNSEQALIRLKDLEIDMARRQIAQIEAMIADFDGMAATLENEIEAEETRTGIRDLAHVAYSILATATIVRRDNLRCTATGLRDELAVAMAKLAAASLD
jgi:flagellar FliJ protein